MSRPSYFPCKRGLGARIRGRFAALRIPPAAGKGSSISDETYHLGEFEPRPDDDVVICRCEEITRGEIRRAVHAGMYTMNEVKRFLRAGMGLCQGQSCNKTVRAIIAQELGISPTETDVITARSPVRPVPMGVYGNDTFYPKFLGGGRDE